MKLNYIQLPIKAHYFFFMAAMGPILPFLPVYGKQLGISALIMGSITAILPILFLIAKPTFGFLCFQVQFFQIIVLIMYPVIYYHIVHHKIFLSHIYVWE
ncbi:major facilitator superfamily domain-containing protein 6 [Apis mellifera caucasica]|nr:major facilitator superfamily domain-containing protein 6 [Apis mellifera caucasica]KAG9428705.1 major facilitator superfamily domain-containing protein 6 [Apis mellifera carnica]